MTDSKECCDGDWRCRSSSKPFAGAESGSPGRALEAGKRGSPGRPVQAGIRGKRLMNALNKYPNYRTYFYVLVLHQHWPIFTKFFPTPLFSISEVMIPNHGNGPKSTHGAGPGSKKHKTRCTLARLDTFAVCHAWKQLSLCQWRIFYQTYSKC